MEYWLKTFGYTALFIGTFIGGEEWLIAAAAFAGKHYLFELKWVIIVAALGGSLGDQVYFYLLGDRAQRLIMRSPRLSRVYPKLCVFINKYGTLTVFLSRFMAGVRITIPVICATTRMSPIKYSVLSLISAALWSTFFGCLAYKAGPLVFDQVKKLRSRWYEALLGLALIIVIWYLLKRRRRTTPGPARLDSSQPR